MGEVRNFRPPQEQCDMVGASGNELLIRTVEGIVWDAFNGICDEAGNIAVDTLTGKDFVASDLRALQIAARWNSDI